ncbi:hypothetical protein LSH36_650g00007 [Paralvinella palmiformis]|uniref:Uncharacterized protein n=1 Tax=Paralvinella palmiformis TaxID=53620 RepID=A0AAD9MVZ1_9ANNE|nr:hypothetical protein LSH36_650g00007 [Paralvinella palmiformis]
MCAATLRRIHLPHTYSYLSCVRKKLAELMCNISEVRFYSPETEHHAASNSKEENLSHVPVMVKQVLEALRPASGQNRVSVFSPQIFPLFGKFSQIHELLQPYGYGQDSLDGALFDVGASSMQFDDNTRGFSLSADGPLDMRMDKGRQPGRDKLYRQAHVATRTFQALRIFVNNELNELYNGLEIVHQLLRPGAPCVAVSFHSLEDRIIKRAFHGIDMDAKINMGVAAQHRAGSKTYNRDEMMEILHKDWDPIMKGAILPSEGEVMENPRARSAKLRAAWKM